MPLVGSATVVASSSEVAEVEDILSRLESGSSSSGGGGGSGGDFAVSMSPVSMFSD